MKVKKWFYMRSKKSKYNSKLNAFTITEIVVVLAISSILSGLAFSVISVIKKTNNAIKFFILIKIQSYKKPRELYQKEKIL